MEETLETRVNTEGGNIQTPSDIDRKKVYRCRKYVYTLNNYNEDDPKIISRFLEYYSSKSCFGLEKGMVEGTPHIQGYMEFKNAKAWDVIVEQCPPFARAWSQKARGSLENNYDYTSKENLFFFKGFNPKKLKYKVEIENMFPWEHSIIKLLDAPPSDRTVHWYWEPLGCTGKTTFQKYLFTHRQDVCILSGKSTDMKNGIVEYIKKTGETPDIVLINIPRSVDHVSYEGIESIKDMFFFSGKYEGGMVCGPSPHVFIFANAPPPMENLSEDRWNIVLIE